MKFKIAFLLLGNILGIIIIFYFLDLLGISNIYSSFKKKSKLENKATLTLGNYSRPGDVDFLEKSERKKMLESFKIREIELEKKESQLNNLQADLKKEIERVSIEKNNLTKQKAKIKKETDEGTSYQKKVEKLATIYYQMPPQNAVERILELNDDLLILDILKEMDNYASLNNLQSTVPFLYSLMPKEEAARLLKKSTVSVN